MTTVDPDTLERDPEVLREFARRFRGRLALNAEVLAPGTISVGDPVLIRPVTVQVVGEGGRYRCFRSVAATARRTCGRKRNGRGG